MSVLSVFSVGVVALAVLAGCLDGPGFTHAYSITTTYERNPSAVRDPPGMSAGAPAAGAAISVLLLDVAHYPPAPPYVICTTQAPCPSPAPSPPHPPGYLETHKAGPPLLVEAGDTLRIAEGMDHGVFRLILDAQGQTRFRVAGEAPVRMSVTMEHEFGPEVDGCQYRYLNGYPGVSLNATGPGSLTVPFRVMCYDPHEGDR